MFERALFDRHVVDEGAIEALQVDDLELLLGLFSDDAMAAGDRRIAYAQTVGRFAANGKLLFSQREGRPLRRPGHSDNPWVHSLCSAPLLSGVPLYSSQVYGEPPVLGKQFSAPFILTDDVYRNFCSCASDVSDRIERLSDWIVKAASFDRRPLLQELVLNLCHLVSGQAFLSNGTGLIPTSDNHGTPVATRESVRVIPVLNQVDIKGRSASTLRPLKGWKDRDDKAVSSSLYDVDSHHDAGVCIGGRLRLRTILALPFHHETALAQTVLGLHLMRLNLVSGSEQVKGRRSCSSSPGN